MKQALYIKIIVIAFFLVWGMRFINCQSSDNNEVKLYFGEDWKEIPAETPVSQKHINNPELVLKLHGTSTDSIRKSHHDKPADDPWYIWSGLDRSLWKVNTGKC